MAPPDLYVRRILERFRLSDYLSLNVERPSEYVLIYYFDLEHTIF